VSVVDLRTEPRRRAALELGLDAGAPPSQILHKRWIEVFAKTANELGLEAPDVLTAARGLLFELVRATMLNGNFHVALENFASATVLIAGEVINEKGEYREEIDVKAAGHHLREFLTSPAGGEHILEDEFQTALDEASAMSFPASDPLAHMGSMLTAPESSSPQRVTSRAALIEDTSLELSIQPAKRDRRGRGSARKRTH